MEIRRFKGKSNAAICISIDDVCPLKLPYGDFGGELATGVSANCFGSPTGIGD